MKQITMVYNYGRGKMTICLDEFFPCTSGELKKLFGVMRLDYEHHDWLLSQIYDFCKEKKEISETNKKHYAKKYSDVHQCRLDSERRIKERKASNGVPLSKDDLKLERDRKALFLESEREFEREFKKNSKTAERLRRNIEQIEVYSKGR